MATQTSPQPTEKPAGNQFEMAWRGMKKPVFIPASIIILLMIVFAGFSAENSQEVFGTLNGWVTEGIGWWYILVVTLFVFFALYVGISKIGNIRLGRDDEKPEFSLVAWFAMLFSAGMGIGLVFWGVAEPLNHMISPPNIDGEVAEGVAAANQALDLTLFHWGIHAWAIYVVVGLGMAYMTYRRGRPLSLRWLLEPLIGRRLTEGAIGNVVDITAIVGTLFGVATSLGLGVQQILAGMQSLGWVSGPSNTAYVLLIAAITAVATFSVVSGVHKGLKWLSNINMGMAAGLMLFVMLAGPTLFLMQAFVQNLGGYLSSLPTFMLRTGAIEGELGDNWLGSWTIFYWGWWMSWAPFVGMFIARISRGRTIREFVFGVLVAPTLVSALWFTVFGESGIARQLTVGDMVGPDGVVDTNLALFTLLDTLPLASITSVVAMLVVAFFFITSSDSGSLVIDMLASGGRTETPVVSRVYWAVLEGVAAAVLLLAGGSAALLALQTASIITAVPVSVVMVVACVSLLRAFRYEMATTPTYLRIVGGSPDLPLDVPGTGAASRPSTGEQSPPGAPGESTGVIVAVQSLHPTSVDVDHSTGTVQMGNEEYLDDPLVGQVFDTPEYASSHQAAVHGDAVTPDDGAEPANGREAAAVGSGRGDRES